MSLNADTLLDRLRLKQQLTKWRIIAIIAALLAALVCIGKFSPIKSDYIARVKVEGIITDDPKVTKLFDDLREDSHVKGVLVWLDTPGGSAVGGQQLYLDMLKTAKTKPVVAVMRTMAASAGYMAALGADHIVAREGSITGSIGVIMESFEVTDLAQKLGIKLINVKSGPYKASPNPLEKFNSDQELIIKGVIKDFFNWFVDIVAERRKMDRSTAESLADGRIYTGRQALQVKLIDELGGEDEARDWLIKNRHLNHHIDIKDVKVENEDQSFLEQITQMANGKFGMKLLQKLDGLNAIWQPDGL